MNFEKGWINRQFARLERDSQNWPDWMLREIEFRAATNSESVGRSSAQEDFREHGLHEPKVARAHGS
jgi:hypothetical protein